MGRQVTPSDLTITPRDRRFGRGERTDRWWLAGNPYGSALYDALSITFPKGEAFFVESVRAFRDGAPPRLAEEIRAFTTQEVMHSREHVAFNKRAVEAGYDIAPLEKRVDERLEETKDRPPIINLAATMALEHFTAVIAHQLLGNPRHLKGADPQSAALWRWHSIEEIEHKGVAFDTWLFATRDWPRWKRWLVKSRVMLKVTRNFFVERTQGALILLAQDGIKGPRAWAGLFWFAMVSPGMFRKILGAWIRFFLPGFHPWNQDDRSLIATAERQLPPALAAQPA
ncbi:MAG TPA: metal-dependent hydrolase [Allosphingosinicella sp.]|nr:metal-dependent hydrolase [Allosphingosinicella sp.]